MPDRQRILRELSIESKAAGTNEAVRNDLEVYSKTEVDAAVGSIDLSDYTTLATTNSISGSLEADITQLQSETAYISGQVDTIETDVATISGDLSDIFTTTATEAASGAAVLPAGPEGFIVIQIGGENKCIPYYAYVIPNSDFIAMEYRSTSYAGQYWTTDDPDGTWTSSTGTGAATNWRPVSIVKCGTSKVCSIVENGIWQSDDDGASWTQIHNDSNSYQLASDGNDTVVACRKNNTTVLVYKITCSTQTVSDISSQLSNFEECYCAYHDGSDWYIMGVWDDSGGGGNYPLGAYWGTIGSLTWSGITQSDYLQTTPVAVTNDGTNFVVLCIHSGGGATNDLTIYESAALSGSPALTESTSFGSGYSADSSYFYGATVCNSDAYFVQLDQFYSTKNIYNGGAGLFENLNSDFTMPSTVTNVRGIVSDGTNLILSVEDSVGERLVVNTPATNDTFTVVSGFTGTGQNIKIGE